MNSKENNSDNSDNEDELTSHAKINNKRSNKIYNIDDIEYKDVAENCFKFKYNKLQCPSDKGKIKTIPIQ